MNPLKSSTVGLVLLLGSHLVVDARAADWPQFRYDAGRTASSPTGLSAELHLQWLRQLPKPRPAFPSEVRLRFDASYEPVVLGKTMFVPSMVAKKLAMNCNGLVAAARDCGPVAIW